jgi:hypothetical protein
MAMIFRVIRQAIKPVCIQLFQQYRVVNVK